MRLTKDITILSPADSGDGTTVKGALQLNSRNEEPGEFSVTDWLLVVGPDTIITHRDRVQANGREYEIVGEPWPVERDLTSGEVHHIEANLKIAGDNDGVDEPGWTSEEEF